MKIQHVKLLFVALCATLYSPLMEAKSVDQLTLHVSVDGSDKNDGCQSSPFCTIERALEAVRESGELAKVPCTILLDDGVYRISKPIQIAADMSGAEGAELKIVAKNRGKAVLSAASVVDLKWSVYRDGIYRAELKNVGSIDQLFVNGVAQRMARYPNYQEASAGLNNFRTIPFNGGAADAWSRAKAAEWSDPTGAYMHTMHKALWGDMHYEVTGKSESGELKYIGGWQNNRVKNISAAHKQFRMIENLFEELDAAAEWYYNQTEGALYLYPMEGVDIGRAVVEITRKESQRLIAVVGDVKSPVAEMMIDGGNGLKNRVKTPQCARAVSHIVFDGLTFTATARSFMQNKESLLRSDWTVFRGGAIHLQGCEDITITNCHLHDLGGNAIFMDGYNRRVAITRSLFERNGATDVNFVGSPAAVRNPVFGYDRPKPNYNTIDTAVGAKSEDYPADCLVEDCLMTLCGRVEKQSAGVNISMSSRITVRHNTIYRVPRAAINICDGTWGGHLVEWNSCFETVLETGDHGSFNSWGRDRYWFPATAKGPRDAVDGVPVITTVINRYPEIMFWDACETNILRNNLMICDHGWDIDLDDGSSNYEIYNNLCLSGGLKTREGYGRKVYNNVIFKLYTCNVPYPAPVYDSFERNILVGGGYSISQPGLWAGKLDRTLFHNPEYTTPVAAVSVQKITGDDAQSLFGDAKFRNPAAMDFSVERGSVAQDLGFENFPMSGFGVTSEHLQRLAPEPRFSMPKRFFRDEVEKKHYRKLFGCPIESLTTESQQTAYGSVERSGAILLKVSVAHYNQLKDLGFVDDDVVLKFGDREIATDRDLIDAFSKIKPEGKSYKVKILRDQVEQSISIVY